MSKEAKELLKGKMINCHNSTTIFDTNTYVKYEDALEIIESLVKKSNDIQNVSVLFPDIDEVKETARSFSELYNYDPEFANGCETGWNAGAQWMKEKYNER